MRKKRFANRVIICFYTAVAVLYFTVSALGADLKIVERCENAAKYTTSDGTYPVLVLRGSWEEMGKQYGALAADSLRLFYEEITADVAQRGIRPDHQLKQACRNRVGGL